MAAVDTTINVETITKDEFDTRVKLFRENQGLLDVQRYETAEKPYFLNTIINYYSQKKTQENDVTAAITAQVEWVVDQVMIPRLNQTGIYQCHSMPCGSAYEDVKVGIPNEFDFIFEARKASLHQDELIIKVTNPDTFLTTRAVSERSFFRVYFRDETPEKWTRLMKCKDCASANDCKQEHDGRYLCSRAVQNDFACTIQHILSGLPAELRLAECLDEEETLVDFAQQEVLRSIPETREVHVGRSGPAANIFLSSALLPDPGIIKVDFTFAIPLHRRCPYSWPLATCDGLKLHDHVLDEYSGIDKCYLVPTGDYWRVSFVSHEKELMSQLTVDKYKKNSLQALKRFRDKLSITDDYEKSLLSSYPLKVSFLKENRDKNLAWDKSHLAERAVSILSRVEQEGEDGNLSSFYIPGDPIQPGDATAAAFVETRRMVRTLDQYTQAYYHHGTVHVILLVLFALSQLTSITVGSFFVGVDINDPCNISSIPPGSIPPGSDAPDASCNDAILSRRVIALIVLSMSFIAWPLVGLLWIKSSGYSTDLYDIFLHIRRLHRAMLVVEFGQGALGVATIFYRTRVLDIFQNIDKRPTWSELVALSDAAEEALWRIQLMAYISMALSAATCFLLLFHVAVVCAFGKESCRKYSYPKRGICSCMYCCFEVVFFDGVYRRICGRLCGRKRRFINTSSWRQL